MSNDLTKPQADMLRELRHRSGYTIAAVLLPKLAENHATVQGVHQTAASLVRRGYLLKRAEFRKPSGRPFGAQGYSLTPKGVAWLQADDSLAADAARRVERHKALQRDRADALGIRAEQRREDHAPAVVRVLEDILSWPETKLAERAGGLMPTAEREITEHVHNMAWAATVGYEWPEHVVTLAEPVLV